MENLEQENLVENIPQEESVPQQSSSKKKYVWIGVAVVAIIASGTTWYLLSGGISSFQSTDTEAQDVHELLENNTENEKEVESLSLVDTSNWILHTHNFRRFSIKLPEEFTKINEDSGGFSFGVKNDVQEYNTVFDVNVFSNSTMENLSKEEKNAIDWLKQAKVGETFDDLLVIGKPSMTNCSAVQFTGVSSKGISAKMEIIETMCFTEEISYDFSLKQNTQEYESLYNAALSTFQPYVNPLQIATDKESYKYGETVEITVTRGDFPSDDEPYLELFDCGLQITRNTGTRIDSGGGGIQKNLLWFKKKAYLGVSDDCVNYSEGFKFEIQRLVTKTFKWDQKSCELKNIMIDAIPDGYGISMECRVRDYRGSDWEGITYGSAGASTGVRIEEPSSCQSKTLQISDAAYDSKNNVSFKVKNTGTENIDNVWVYMQLCDNGDPKVRYYSSLTSKDLGEIKVGEEREYVIEPRASCQYEKVSVHVFECYDGNPNTWAESSIIP